MEDTFNPEKYADELQASGVPAHQASIHAHNLRAAVNYLISKIEIGNQALMSRIDLVNTTLASDMAIMKAELGAKMDSLRTDINSLSADMDSLRTQGQSLDRRLHHLEYGFGAMQVMTAANLTLAVRLTFL